jgi:two-component system NarL family sensor kinase
MNTTTTATDVQRPDQRPERRNSGARTVGMAVACAVVGAAVTAGLVLGLGGLSATPAPTSPAAAGQTSGYSTGFTPAGGRSEVPAAPAGAPAHHVVPAPPAPPKPPAPVLVYLAAGIATRVANEEPWASLLQRTLLLAGVGVGCFGLSRIQRSRVRTIGALVRDRTDLLAELTDLERRERRSLSEHLHDGALQYVLAARQDLDEARETGDPGAFTRVEHALVESSQILRSTVAELHPAVLDRAGLPAALRELARNAGARGGFAVDLDVRDWPDDLRTPADALLYRTARELLANVVKHAAAGSVTVALTRTGDRARLTVADDGRGIPDGAVRRSLQLGHIGLASHALRVEAAGGSLTLRPGRPGGTVAVADVPWPS